MERRVARIAELDRRLLLRRRAAARGLDEHAQADAAQLTALPRSFSSAVKTSPGGKPSGFSERPRRIAAVVGGAGRRLVRESPLRDEVAPAQLHALDAGCARRLVN